MRVLIADDHGIVRSGLRKLLESEEGIDVVAEAADGAEARDMALELRPDLAILDVKMPVMTGLEATRAIHQEAPDVAILILSMHDEERYLFEALKAGAAGYVLKDAPRTQLVDSVRSVLSGEPALDQKLTVQLLQRLAADLPASAKEDPGPQPADSTETLTPRETEVLQLLARGLSNQEVSRELVVSVGTAKNHVQHIISKLSVSDRTQAVVRGLEMGIISLPTL